MEQRVQHHRQRHDKDISILSQKEVQTATGIVALLAIGRYVVPHIYDPRDESLSLLPAGDDTHTPVVLDVLKSVLFILEILVRAKIDMKKTWIGRLAAPDLGLQYEGPNYHDKLMCHDVRTSEGLYCRHENLIILGLY